MVVAALLTLYLVWGSTPLGIKFAVATLPPFTMSGARYCLAGLVLFGVVLFRRVPLPSGADWRQASINGFFLFVGGNGLVTWGQKQQVPAGVSSLLIATTPLWMALIEWLFYRGKRPTLWVVLGMVLAFAGLVVLIPAEKFSGQSEQLIPMLSIAAAPIPWCLGSLRGRSTAHPRNPFMTASAQMICGGIEMMLVGGILGEWGEIHSASVSWLSLGSFFYLGLFGSLIGFTVYTWLLNHTSPAAVATYAYVNPLVAVVLAWLFANEEIDWRLGGAAGLIVGAVILTTAIRPARHVVTQEGEPDAEPETSA